MNERAHAAPQAADHACAGAPADEPGRPRARGAGARLLGALPTAGVLALLAGAGLWGHHHGWKVPKFSELAGLAASPRAGWCEEHGVPESICIACNADLMPKDKLRGWCREHGVAECVLDHPELAQARNAPQVPLDDWDRAARALLLRPRRENNSACKLHLRRIQLADQQAVEKAGIDIRLAERAPVVESVAANAEAAYDPTRVARLASRAPGTVWRVEKELGDPVRAGDVLALVDSAEVGRAKADLLQAQADLELAEQTRRRLADLDGVLPGRRLQEIEAERAKAEAAARRAIQTLSSLGLPVALEAVQGKPVAQVARQLQFLGLPGHLTAGLEPGAATANLVPVAAPRDGVVVRRDVAAGEVIASSQPLFTVADPSRMWLLLDVPQEDAGYVRLGQKVVFQPDGQAGPFAGAVTWMSTEIDRETRTVKVRAELANEDGRLRSETFGAARIVLREEPEAVVVPAEAVHWEGCCHVVFVRDKDFLKDGAYKVFHTRMVRPGATAGDVTELIAGVLPGEVVATKGSGALRAELLKGNLGAG